MAEGAGVVRERPGVVGDGTLCRRLQRGHGKRVRVGPAAAEIELPVCHGAPPIFFLAGWNRTAPEGPWGYPAR